MGASLSTRKPVPISATKKVPAEPRAKLVNLVKRPGVIVGDAGRLDRIAAFDEAKWRKKWATRFK